MRTRHLLTVLLATVVVLSGCSSDTSKPDGGDTSALQKRLTTAKSTLDDAETVQVSMATKSLPDGITGLLSATGTGNHSPAFAGKVTVVTGGASLSADVVAVDGTVYAKTGFAPTFLTIDPASLKAPNPAELISTDAGITQLLVKTDDLAEGDRSRDGKDVLTTITGTLPGSVVKTIIPSATADETFTVVYRLDDDDVLRDATLRGVFYAGSPAVTYTVAVKISNSPVTITKP